MLPYKLTNSSVITRTNPDGTTSSIPPDPANTDYQQYLTWVAAGNTSTPADPPVVLKHGVGHFEGDAHTSGAASAEMFRATLPTLSQFNVRMNASGIATDNGAQRTLWVLAVVQRLNNGASVIGQNPIGNIASPTGSPVATTAFALTASGNDVVITVTGLAAREIDWVLTGEFVRIRPAGLA